MRRRSLRSSSASSTDDGTGTFGVEQAEDGLLAGTAGLRERPGGCRRTAIADSATLLREPSRRQRTFSSPSMPASSICLSRRSTRPSREQRGGGNGPHHERRDGRDPGHGQLPVIRREPVRHHRWPAVQQSGGLAPVRAGIGDEGRSRSRQPSMPAPSRRPDTFDDDNNLMIGSIRIQNADRADFPYGHGPITASDVLALSNNVGAAKIGLTLGRAELYEAFRRFGFGAPTGIELTGEASGVVWNPDGPNASGDLTAAQNAFGQGLSMTAVQLIAGYASFANGGSLVTPHVVAGWTDPDGTYHVSEQPPPERIMRAETAATMVDLLTNAIDDGIADGAQIDGYTVAGKTGTAQIAGPVQVHGRERRDGGALAVHRRLGRLELRRHPARRRPQARDPDPDPPTRGRGRSPMPERPETVYADLMPQVLDYLAIAPDRPRETGRPAMTTARLARSPQRGPCASHDPSRRAAGRRRRPPRMDRPRSPPSAGASVDSRRVTPGSIYVALRGERVDGHRFVVDAHHCRGCRGARRAAGRPPAGPRRRDRSRGRPAHRTPGACRVVAVAASRCEWWASPGPPARRSPRRSPPTCCHARSSRCGTRATSTRRPGCR